MVSTESIDELFDGGEADVPAIEPICECFYECIEMLLCKSYL